MRFDNAKQQLSESRPDCRVVVHYFPFMIDPETQPDGEPYHDYNRSAAGFEPTRPLIALLCC